MSHSSSQSKYTRRYHPCHPLAQYLISQIETMQLCAPDIIKAMGYPLGHTIPACERLRHVLCNRYLGLDGSYMDKYFTADAFLAKLFIVLELPYEPFVKDIDQIKYQLAHLSNPLPKYSLRVEVDFEFDSANWMSGYANKSHQLIVEQKHEAFDFDRVGYELPKSSSA